GPAGAAVAGAAPFVAVGGATGVGWAAHSGLQTKWMGWTWKMQTGLVTLASPVIVLMRHSSHHRRSVHVSPVSEWTMRRRHVAGWSQGAGSTRSQHSS